MNSFISKRRVFFLIMTIPVLIFYQNCGNAMKSNNGLSSVSSSTQGGEALEQQTGPVQISLEPKLPATLQFPSFSSQLKLMGDSSSQVNLIECQIDNRNSFDCTNLNVNLTKLTTGSHSFWVQARDSESQLVGEALFQFQVQLPQPILSLSFSPIIPSQLNTKSLKTSIQVGSTSGNLGLASATCQLDSQVSFDCSNLQISFNNLSNGSHNLVVNGVDTNGQTVPSLSSSFTVQVGNQPNGTVNVDPSQTYQTITGHEAMSNVMPNNPNYNQYIKRALDNAVNKMGATRIRLEVRSGAENNRDIYTEYKNGLLPYSTYKCLRYSTVNDNNNPNQINTTGFHFSFLDEQVDKAVIPLKKKLESLGKKLYINLNYVAFTQQMTGQNCPAGLQYIHTNENEYAELMLAAVQHLQSKYGIVPDGIEIILEPDLAAHWKDGKQVGRAVVATANLLSSKGYSPDYIAPSTTSMTNATKFIDGMALVPGAINFVKEFSYHKYSFYGLASRKKASIAIANKAKQYGKQTSMLEWWSNGNNYIALHEDLKYAMVSAWQMGGIAAQTTAKSALSLVDDRNPQNIKVFLGKGAKIVRQYFKYIRPGALRIDATSSKAQFDPLAFINSDGKYVVVIKATSGGSFSVGHLPPGTYGISYSTGTASGVILQDKVVSSNGLANISIPAAGAITVFQK